MTWRPPSQREAPDPRFDVLHEGVPAWLDGSLQDWLDTFFPVSGQESRYGDLEPSIESLKAWGRENRIHVDDFQGLLDSCSESAVVFIDTCAWLIHHLAQQNWVLSLEASKELSLILDQAGSAWCVVARDKDFILERRVPAAVRDSFEQAVSASDRAGHHLSHAWSSAFGRSPNPDHAYDQAVKAVETVAKPVALPNDSKATLGKVIKAMGDKPAKWRLSIASRDGSDADSIPRVVDMLRLLWEGNKRHGTADGRPANHTVEEAQAAVVLAATLVHWFGGGHVRPVADPP